MNSRMDKYRDEELEKDSRTSRNQNIYNNLEDRDYENLDLEGNISVLGTDVNSLDIDKLKTLLNERYSTESPKKKTVEQPLEQNNLEDIDKEETKEYDLKKVIEDAHKNKIVDYDKERFQKLKKTQFEILNSLNIEKGNNQKKDESLTREETDLINLIKTVNEKKENDNSSDDLLDDLKGNEKTEVLTPISIDDEDESNTGKKPTIVEELEKTKRLSRQELDDEIEKLTSKLDDVIEKIKDQEIENTNKLAEVDEMTNSFYTDKLDIEANDIDDFADLEKEMNGSSIVIKLLILLLVFVTLAICVYLLNKYLNLGLF